MDQTISCGVSEKLSFWQSSLIEQLLCRHFTNTDRIHHREKSGLVSDFVIRNFLLDRKFFILDILFLFVDLKPEKVTLGEKLTKMNYESL